MTEVKVKDNTEVYVMGDMNINKTCTRFSATSRSTIDLIYTNSEYVGDSGCIDINISDHLAMYVTCKKVPHQLNSI